MLKLGTTEECIAAEEKRLGVIFPSQFREIFLISNGLELPDDWILYPIFDPNNPKKTSSSIFYENTTGRCDYMDEKFISIASNGWGDKLVIKKQKSGFSDGIYYWNHETNKINKWQHTFSYIKKKAEERRLKIKNLRKRS